MPELPEVEHLRRTLEPHIIGRRVERALLRRRDICESVRAGRAVRTLRRDLLEGAEIAGTMRRGKQLAIAARDGRVLCVHLGMTGGLVWRPDESEFARTPHVHATWRLSRGCLAFIDPRRFGGLWTLESREALDERWRSLGPDALTVTVAELAEALRGSRRAVKAVLLDQECIAGVGNIYADESLFLAGIAPTRPSLEISNPDAARLTRAIRDVLGRAIDAGGSTLRNYRDAQGNAGTAQTGHLVYGRAGLPCSRCSRPLKGDRLAQRATVWCTNCQPN